MVKKAITAVAMIMAKIRGEIRWMGSNRGFSVGNAEGILVGAEVG
jgi:hypothetical protein